MVPRSPPPPAPLPEGRGVTARVASSDSAHVSDPSSSAFLPPPFREGGRGGRFFFFSPFPSGRGAGRSVLRSSIVCRVDARSRHAHGEPGHRREPLLGELARRFSGEFGERARGPV